MQARKSSAKGIGLTIATLIALVVAIPPATAGPVKIVFDLKDCALSLDPINCLLDVYCEGQRLPNVDVQRCHFIDGWCVGTIIPERTIAGGVNGVHVIGNVYVAADVQSEDFGVFAQQGSSESGDPIYSFLGFSGHCAD